MEDIRLEIKNAYNFVSREAIDSFKPQVEAANRMLHDRSGAGSDFLGWLNLPSEITEAYLSEIENAAALLQKACDLVVVIGIGGSYLGAKAVIDALSNSFDWLQTKRSAPIIIYAGQNISEDYLFELQELLRDKRFGIISISKSGTTTEPALAFRLLRTQLEQQQGKEQAQQLIITITDKARGALHLLSEQENYKSFVIEDNIGGRFSVFSPVGLLPIATAGFDIRAFVAGAVRMQILCDSSVSYEKNIACQYAAVRNALYSAEKKMEILANYHPKLQYISEWWKQLYGESEGKQHKGIFPASVNYTTDLHSMGQWIQDGERTIFETVLLVEMSNYEKRVPFDTANLDGLNFLANRRVDDVNRMAALGTMLAHLDGGVPNLTITLPKLDAYYLGQLLYFFEKACGISGYVLGVNPFDQPGVEAYKKNMFALLDKPGHEDESKALKARLQ